MSPRQTDRPRPSAFIRGSQQKSCSSYADIGQLFEKSEKSSQKPLPSNFDVEALVRELELCTSREQSEAILERRCNLRRKKDFHDILTHLETAFNKREKIAVLKEKVIENTIGYRIRSQAIQNYGEAIK